MDIGKLYSFNTTSPVVLGDRYENVKLVRSGLGNQFENIVDIQSRNIQVSNLTGIPADDISVMLCHMFITENNEQLVLADEWINKNTLTTGSKINFSLIVSDISLEDKATILQTLDSMGYSIITQKITQLT